MLILKLITENKSIKRKDEGYNVTEQRRRAKVWKETVLNSTYTKKSTKQQQKDALEYARRTFPHFSFPNNVVSDHAVFMDGDKQSVSLSDDDDDDNGEVAAILRQMRTSEERNTTAVVTAIQAATEALNRASAEGGVVGGQTQPLVLNVHFNTTINVSKK